MLHGAAPTGLLDRKRADTGISLGKRTAFVELPVSWNCFKGRVDYRQQLKRHFQIG
jgi:hypothetical protein